MLNQTILCVCFAKRYNLTTDVTQSSLEDGNLWSAATSSPLDAKGGDESPHSTTSGLQPTRLRNIS